MGSQFIHIFQYPEFFLASRVLSSRPRIVHVTHNLKLFITSRALSSRLRLVLVNHNLELFMEYRALSSRLGVLHVIHRPQFLQNLKPQAHDQESFISSSTPSYSQHLKALGHGILSHYIIYNNEVFIPSKVLSSRCKVIYSSITLSCSLCLEP